MAAVTGTGKDTMIDLAIYGILAVAVAAGLYRGFVHSLARLLAFFLAWVIALGAYPSLARWVQTNTTWINTLHYYTEDSYRITDLELWRADVDTIPPGTMQRIKDESTLVQPFDRMFNQNLEAKTLRPLALTTLKDYFNYTIVFGIANILSFLTVFALVHIGLMLLLEAADYVFHFPVIRIWDPVGGVLVGLLYGVLVVSLVISLLPIGLVIVPGDMLTKLVDASKLLPAFERYEWVSGIVRGII